jgi:4'-phosphopantetheinyl transferase EntD
MQTNETDNTDCSENSYAIVNWKAEYSILMEIKVCLNAWIYVWCLVSSVWWILVIERILPEPTAAVESFSDCPVTTLFPEEQAVIGRAAESRQKEFATGRACARAALARLGRSPGPVLPGVRGAPQWPEGVVGSITHCDGYRAAAVALIRDVVSMGVDAEPNEPLPDHGMIELIARKSERARLNELAARGSAVRWDRLLFSAKESVYKTWFPLARRWLDFESADVVIDPDRGTFTACLLVQGPLVGGSPLTRLNGRWLAAHGLLLTAVVVPA